MAKAIKAIFFASAKEFRAWLRKNHAKETELWVGMYKKSSGKPSIDWPQAVDQALCFGWIDGLRKSIDDESFMQRFTPRRRGSYWSAINTKRAKELIELELMTPAGLKAFEARDANKTKMYSFERENVALTPSQTKQFRANKKAWAFFESQSPSYRKQAMWYVMSAKQEATQQRRLEVLIADSERGERIELLRRPPKNK